MTSVYRRAPAPVQRQPPQPNGAVKAYNQPPKQAIVPVQQQSAPVNQSRYVKSVSRYQNEQLNDQYDDDDEYNNNHVNQPHNQATHQSNDYYQDQQYEEPHQYQDDQTNDYHEGQYYDEHADQYDDHEGHHSNEIHHSNDQLNDQYMDEPIDQISQEIDDLAIDQHNYGEDDQSYDDPIDHSLHRVDESELEPEDSQQRKYGNQSNRSTPVISSTNASYSGSSPLPTLGSTFPSSSNQSFHPSSSRSFESPMASSHGIPEHLPGKLSFNHLVDDWVARLKLARHDSATLGKTIQLLQTLRTQYLIFTRVTDRPIEEQTASMIDALTSRLNSHRLNPLVSHCLSQVIDHLSVALAGIGYFSFGQSAVHIAVSARDARSLALRAALRAKPMTAPQVYLPGRLAGDIDALSLELRLPVSHFHVLPTVARKGSHSSTAIGAIHTVDIRYLDTLLSRHQRERKSPAILILSLGTSGEGAPFQSDDLDDLLPLAQHYNMWLHAEGTQVIECGEPSGPSEDPEHALGSFADQLDGYISLNKEVKTASFITSQVHSLTFDASQFITVPSSLGVCLFTGLTELAPEILPHSHSAMSSLHLPTLLTAWWVLTGQSSQSFHNLIDLFPICYQETINRLNAAMDTIESSGLNVTLAPVHSEQIPRAPHMLLSFALRPPFNGQFFQFSQTHVQELLADLLARECEFDEMLGQCYANPSFIPSVNAHDHHAFSLNFSARTPVESASNDIHIDMFNHFVSTVHHCMDIVALNGKVHSEMVRLIEAESDLQFVDASLLNAHSRPGFVAFRFTPASIPASFHNELTHALSIALTSTSPELYRSAGTYDGDECTIIDICSYVHEMGPRAIVDAIIKQTKRMRLPATVEAHLADELKARILETESQLKTSSQPGGIRSVPIVGSLFSLFASAAKPKGHSYDIKSGSFADVKPAQPAQPAQQTLPKKELPVHVEPQRDEPHSQFREAHHDDASHEAEEQQYLDDESERARDYEEQQQLQYDEAEFVDPAHPDEQPAQAGDYEHEYESQMQHSYDEQEHSHHNAAHPLKHVHSAPSQHGEITVQMHPYREEPQEATEDSDALFSTLSSRDPNELMNFISDGDVLTIFFPNPEAPGLHAIQLYLFYSAEDAALCWCEPGARYCVPDQTLPISKISELHLGATMESFPHDADSSKCFSIISDLITLHCEAEDAYRRNEMLLALYALLSNTEADASPSIQHTSPPVRQQSPATRQQSPPQSAPQQQPRQHAQQPAQQPKQQQQSARQPAQQSALVHQQQKPQQASRPPTHPPAQQSPPAQPITRAAPTPLQTQLESRRTGRHPVAGPPPHTPSRAAHPQVPASVSNALTRALSILENGTPFTVFLMDRAAPHITTRHSVQLWWRPDADGSKGRLCWSRRAKHGETKLEYHPSRSLLLTGAVEVLLGKQSKAFRNPGLDDVITDTCVTIAVDRTNLNLAAASQQQRDQWLEALHQVMTQQGSKIVTAL